MGSGADEPADLILSMSSCSGLYGCQAAQAKLPLPYFLLLGPTRRFDWPDGLTAWITFYHLFVYRNFDLQNAIKTMNLAAGFDEEVFAAISGQSMAQHYAMLLD
jgi:hypothetical protein